MKESELQTPVHGEREWGNNGPRERSKGEMKGNKVSMGNKILGKEERSEGKAHRNFSPGELYWCRTWHFYSLLSGNTKFQDIDTHAEITFFGPTNLALEKKHALP